MHSLARGIALDGTPVDNCESDPNKTEPGVCGCGVADTDTDGDGTADCNDTCDSDPNKIVPGICGCNEPEDPTDTDGDGTWDCAELAYITNFDLQNTTCTSSSQLKKS